MVAESYFKFSDIANYTYCSVVVISRLLVYLAACNILYLISYLNDRKFKSVRIKLWIAH